MEKISINNEEKKYDILNIAMISENILKIEFAGDIPENYYGDITVYTSGDIQCANLTGFSTIYRKQENAVYLSNDQSIWEQPEDMNSETYILSDIN